MSTTHISFRVPDWLADALGEESNRSGMNRSEIVREALERRLNFGGAQGDDNGGGGRDGDAAAEPPDLSDALGQIKRPERVRRTTGMMTSASTRAVPTTRRPTPQPDPDPERRAWVRRRAKDLHAAGMTAPIASRKALTEWEERRR